MSTGNVDDNMNRAISQAEFQNLLNKSALKASQKEKIQSIFTKVSQGDGELSAEDWDNFMLELDINKDGKLNANEIAKANSNKNGLLYKQGKDVIVDFFNMFTRNKDLKTRQNGSVEIHYAKPNPYRATKTRGSGTFDGDWIAHDKYNSSTYEQWLANNGYEFNHELGNELQRQARKRDTGGGHCAGKILDSLSHVDTSSYVPYSSFGILNDSNDGQNPQGVDEDSEYNGLFQDTNLFNDMETQGSAYKYGSELANNPYFKEIPHNIVSTMDLKTLPKGCVVVYDAHYKQGIGKDGSVNYHPHGHIAVTDGNGKDSGDGYYNMVVAKQETHIRVFIPIVVDDIQA